MKIKWKYAIGEIVIVIIGISIAFALNNWKEGQNNRKQKKQYLENLILDIEQEMEHLNENQVKVQDKLKLIGAVKQHLGRKLPGRDTIVMKVFELPRLVGFNPENTTYETLINSGDMKLIDNFELRRSVEKHYSKHSEIDINYGRIEKINENYIGDFFIHEIDFNKVRQGNIDFLDKPLLMNIVNSLEGAYYMILSSNAEGLKSNEALLEQLKAEL
ncbi:MAG: hypothetical protein KTR13_07865 [Saprospiraceae bacterium]|nr:hypothetical protein [Saprospiraceae bacterium]